MRLTRKLSLRFRSLFQRSRVEDDLSDELRDYVEREIEREIAAGSSPEEARQAVTRAMQGTERLKEGCRDARGTRWIEDGLKDLRFAFRTMRRAPAFTLTVVVALGLCIGANTAIFSVVDTILFRPLPFTQQDRLVFVTEGIAAIGIPVMPFSCPDYLFVAANARSFESTATYRTQSYEISGVGQPRRANAARVTASLFHVLDVAPAFGRAFTKEEDDHSKSLLILTYGFAINLFGSPQSALGRTIHVDRKPYTVIGVMPRSFSFPPRALRFSGDPAELFVPVSWSKHEREDWMNNFNYSMIARLGSGITMQQAAAETRALVKRIPANYSEPIKGAIQRRWPNFSLESQIVPFREEVTGKVQQPLLILLTAVGVVLLIACADVANLMFSRMVGRQREFALRAALGAGRWRLARQMLTEGLLLSLAGGIAGALLAFWTLPVLLRFAPDNLPRLNEVAFNWRVAAFVFVIALATPLFFCCAPLIDMVRSAIGDRLRGGGRTNTQSRQQHFVMSGTVVVQFSLALILLTCAGLLLRSFVKASEANPGFRPEHVVTVRISLPQTIYTKQAQIASFYEGLLKSLSTFSDVKQTGAMTDLPMGSSSNGIISAKGHASTENEQAIYCAGDALSTLRIPLLRGRLLQPEDSFRQQPVAVISKSLADRIWPGKDPIGGQIKFGIDDPVNDDPWMTVVGVVTDVKDRLTSASPRPMVFTATSFETFWSDMNILVRTTGDPLTQISAIRRAVNRLDSRLPIEHAQTLDQILDQSLSAERFRTFLLASFAAVALLLALLGIGGLLSYSTAQRAQEFGVRIALGAGRRDLLVLIFGQSLRLSMVGIAIGLVASVAATRALSALLYDTSQYDPATFVGVPVLLAVVALGASAIPAWRAIHADPIAALKAE